MEVECSRYKAYSTPMDEISVSFQNQKGYRRVLKDFLKIELLYDLLIAVSLLALSPKERKSGGLGGGSVVSALCAHFRFDPQHHIPNTQYFGVVSGLLFS